MVGLLAQELKAHCPPIPPWDLSHRGRQAGGQQAGG
jgi:hypothetical protein